MSKNLYGAVCLALAAAIWGGMYVVSKYILDYVPPMSLMWLRYAIASILLISALAYYGRKEAKGSMAARLRTDWRLLVWIAFIGYFGSIAMQFFGTKLSDAHTGALITSATPAFVVVFARIILNEPATWKKILSLVLAMAGVVTVIGWVPTEGDYFKGTLILVGAAVSWALLSVYVKVASERLSSLEITASAIFIALLMTTPFMLLELRHTDMVLSDPSIVSGILYVGIMATAVAFFLWNKGLELMSAGAGSLFLFLQPVVGAVLGWLCLGERLTVNFFAGGLLIVAGVIIATLNERKTTTDA